ncbi:MAG: hypothetical protein ABIE23_00915 [archaeon]|nr:hypothetical protein [Candidatus Micrarchaeota archaeon]
MRKWGKGKTAKAKVGHPGKPFLFLRRKRTFHPKNPNKKIRVVFICPQGAGSREYGLFLMKLLKENKINSFFEISSFGEEIFYDNKAKKLLPSIERRMRQPRLELVERADYIFFSYADVKRPTQILGALKRGNATSFTIIGYREDVSKGKKNIESIFENVILKEKFKEEGN